MEAATLIIAVFGAVIGAASLGWGVASYTLSGGRVKNELLGGWVGAALVSGPLTASLAQPDATFHEPVLAVRARNLGRLPVVVEGWYVRMDQINLGHVQHAANPAIPFTLARGESETWVVPLAEVMAAAEAASNAGFGSRSFERSSGWAPASPDPANRLGYGPQSRRTFRLTVEVHDRGPLPAILRDAADRIEATPPDRKVSRSTSDTGGLVGSSCSWMTTRCDSR
jgi:hypothetical protein